MRISRPLASTAAIVSMALGLSACGYTDLNSLTLPGVKGAGHNSYAVTIEFNNTQDLVTNSPVRVGDLNVGTVRSIELKGYQPMVTVSLDGDVVLPANAEAKIGQTSLLGAKHVEIDPPAGAKPLGRLKDGDTITLKDSASYPATEEILASVSALLNGGGLQHIRTITTEVNKVLSGREETTRELLDQTRTFTAGLDAQKADIVSAIDELDRLSGKFRKGNKTVADALDALPPALRVVKQQREQLVETLESLGRFGDETSDFVYNGGGRDLVANIASLDPALKGLADAGSSLVDSLWIVPTVVFPIQKLDQFIRGDFYNLIITLDLRTGTLSKGILDGTPLDSLLGTPNGLLGQQLTPDATSDSGDDTSAETPPSKADPSEPTPSSDGVGGLLELLLGGGK